ncbi:MAG: hydroxymethylglutaryl-CoA lyase [Oligoflexia bacterium]|nr:hydroxymethylglutaryl-CoA lyase [Oligoflexia bacterium]
MNFQNLPNEVTVIEVGPRDGLQNEKTILKTEDKVEFISKLAKAGLKEIEATSFVRADKIPQMGDAEKLFTEVLNIQGVNFPCLVPNLKGLEKALAVGVKEIAVFSATSETFNKKNINASIDESLERITAVCEEAKKHGLKIRGYVSTAFGCPYEGETSIDKLIEVTKQLLKLGAYEVSIGDTIGVATPIQVQFVVNKLLTHFKKDQLALHFHDTRGMALSNILTALTLGIHKFDSSAGGLGGCPYAKGATGNVATEDLVYLLNSLGINSHIDLDKLAHASEFILEKLNRKTSSKYLQAYLNSK